MLDDFFANHPDWKCVADYLVKPPTAAEVLIAHPEADDEVLDRCLERIRFGGGTVTRGTLYLKSRACGNSHAFAAACAMQRSAYSMTDDVFWGGRAHFGDVYGDRYFGEVKQLLASRGHSLTSHEEYLPELARYKGDPEAVVSRSEGRAKIRKLCEQRGWGCEGGIRTKHRAPESDPLDKENITPLADDLVAEAADTFARANPDEARKMTKQDMKDHMVAQHGPQN